MRFWTDVCNALLVFVVLGGEPNEASKARVCKSKGGLFVFAVLRGGLWGMSRAVCVFFVPGWSVLEGCLERVACVCCVAWRFVGDVSSGLLVCRVMLVGLGGMPRAVCLCLLCCVAVCGGCLERFACFSYQVGRFWRGALSVLLVFGVLRGGLSGMSPAVCWFSWCWPKGAKRSKQSKGS